MKTKIFFSVALLGIFSLMSADRVTAIEEVSTYLNRFHENPSAVMDEVVPKFDLYGNAIHRDLSKHEQEIIAKSRDHFRKKIVDKKMLFRSSEEKSSYVSGDRVQELIPASLMRIERNIHALDAKRLTSGKVATQPWSDDYWPVYKGGLGFRYADKKLGEMEHTKWNNFFNYVKTYPAATLIEQGNSSLLSPSEKYDLLIGANISPYGNQGLTAKMWKEGDNYARTSENGEVETWFGICHGWAAASYMLPRAIGPVIVQTAAGALTFYPADIKALASLFWANFQFKQSSVGGRCNVKPEKLNKDRSSGRITDQECFDTNPGTWHLAVTHLLGMAKKTFIIDANFDYEVWNQPLLTYRYNYFNPQTFKEYVKAENAMIKIKNYKKDKFKNFRSDDTSHVVGVRMKIAYMVENTPVQRVVDHQRYDAINTAEYLYDLELDQRGNIIGGEWYHNTHPDFLWTPDYNLESLSAYDRSVEGEWNSNNAALPDSWAKAAKASAINASLPLGKIISELLRRSTVVE
ncbi:MAG: hypothetical protein HQK52_00635 [Oligoflexia bacterium]|nr:hypothetical protein [Oligoflexia bacterium]